MSQRIDPPQPAPFSQLLEPANDQAASLRSSDHAQAGLGKARSIGSVVPHHLDHELVRTSLAPQAEFFSATYPSNPSLAPALAPPACATDNHRKTPRQFSPALVRFFCHLAELVVLLCFTASNIVFLVTNDDHVGMGVPITLLVAILAFEGIRCTLNGRSSDTLVPLGNLSLKLAIWLSVSSTMSMIAWMFQPGQSNLSIYLATWVFLGTLVVYGMHDASGWVWRRLASAKRLAQCRVAIVGASKQAAHLIARLHKPDAAPLFDIVGIFDDRIGGNRLPPGRFAGEWLGGRVSDLLERDRSEPLDIIVVAIPHNAVARLNEIVDKLGGVAPAHIRHCPDLVNFDAPLACIIGADDLTAFLGRIYFEKSSQLRYYVKSFQDSVLATLLLLLLGPLMLLIALVIRIDSPGPVLFKQKRFGRWNRPFEVLKFRTMFHHRCDPTGSTQTVRDDARVTRVGRILRKSSMDELPQILNILRGEMSVVGPRPHPVFMNVCGVEIKKLGYFYSARHCVKPGITGLSQINGLRGEIDSITKAKKVVEMDLQYVRDWTLLGDLKIILKTAVSCVRDPAAY